MNIIKGLIIKDLTQLKSYRKTLFVFIAIFLVFSAIQNNFGGLAIVMFTLGFGMFSIASFSYDEVAASDKYILSFPITRKEMVISKYVLVIISTILGAIIGTIVSILMTFVITNNLNINLIETISTALGALFGISVIQSIQIPCIYKYGAEKGRMQLFIFVMIFGIFIAAVIYFLSSLNINLFEKILSYNLFNFVPLILPILTIIAYLISYLVSYKIFTRKEL